MVSHLRFWSHNLHSWCDRIVVLGFSVLFFSQFECKVIHSSHNLVYPSLLVLSLRISHIWRFWLLEDLESSTKKNSGKISSQFLKFLVFRAQFWGSHNGNSQFRSEMCPVTVALPWIFHLPHSQLISWEQNFTKYVPVNEEVLTGSRSVYRFPLGQIVSFNDTNNEH